MLYAKDEHEIVDQGQTRTKSSPLTLEARSTNSTEGTDKEGKKRGQ